MKDFYKGKRVLITGHMGFKGTWLSMMLVDLGATVIGYGRDNQVIPSIFAISGVEDDIRSVEGDVCELDQLKRTFEAYQPEIVFHLAAQPIVRASYEQPVDTYQTNVMGTVHVLECIRLFSCVKSFVNVTTDKVYRNLEMNYCYKEEDELNGFDPYSNSKSCSELVTASYKNSFFQERQIGVSTARAGNVLGGGDFSPDRIIPDCVRETILEKSIIVRNPDSIRPYQYVLEALYAYLLIGAMQFDQPRLGDCYNIGPEEEDCVTTGELVEHFCQEWEGASWINKKQDGPHEAGFLKLDSGKLKKQFQWKPQYHIKDSIQAVVEWSKAYEEGQDMALVMKKQIHDYWERREGGKIWKELY